METAELTVVRHASERPDFLAIGHITRDLLPGGSWRLGGAVTYTALTAARLGLRPAIITSAPPDVLAALDAVLPDLPLSAISSDEATTFENIYTPQGRQQVLHGRAASLALSAVPEAWHDTPIVLLAPVAQEIDASVAGGFPNSLVAATPQGWLRQWDADGAVTPSPLANADVLLPHLRALVLSREDIGASADTIFGEWARIVPLIVVTCGRDGAYVWEHGVRSEMFVGYPANEVDPTGAGDVFAAAFLCELHGAGDTARAIDFANQVAACSVEAVGGEGIPTREMVAARWGVTD
jgi:sugar/nucleoside kinase (ribokinase family)